VASLLFLLVLRVNVHCLTIAGVADLFDGKFDTSDLEDVFLLDFIVNFFIIMLKTSDDQVHLFGAGSQLTSCLGLLGHIILMVGEGSTLEIEGAVSVVDNLE